MLSYLLKRFVWIIPTLWFITSVVFVLSKLIPGSGTSIFDDESDTKASARTEFYDQYILRTGQNLPLFYCSIHTLAEPDTLYRVISFRDKQLLKQLIFTYGNWSAISTYFHQLKALHKANSYFTQAKQRNQFLKDVETLYTQVDAQAVQHTFTSINRTLAAPSTNSLLIQAFTSTQQSFLQLVKSATPSRNYIPTVHWHGSENQYHQWFVQVINGNMGISLRDARPVGSILQEAITNTFLLSLFSLLLVFTIAIGINLLIIHEDYKKLHKLVLYSLYVLDTIPVFMLALFLVILLAAGNFLQLFPVYGIGEISSEMSSFEYLGVHLYHLVIPITCLTLTHIPYVTSQLYETMREVKYMDFVLTARAKGIAEGKIVRKHIFRNSLYPLITIFSGFIPALLGGAVVIEVIFAIPGMGRLLVDSIQARDYPVILGIVLVMAFAKIIANIVADVLYYLADPRVTFSHDQ